MRLTVLLLLPMATTAAAQSPPAPPPVREHVVVTATVAPVPFDALTRSVSLITREDLEKLGVTSVAEALRLLPGVDPKARGPRDVQTDFSIRAATFGQSLVLVDGLRLNDSQSGHHNGDIPAPLAAIDRIEVLAGTGSAVHGADALGGTINILTRSDRHALASVAAGQHGYVSAQGSAAGIWLPDAWMVTGWGARSDGFTFDRDFAYGGGALRGRFDDEWTIDVRHQRKAFGANQFYGPSPSKEWTDQTVAALAWQRAHRAWIATMRAQWRNHGDHFRWDIHRPGFAENHHRTDAAEATVTLARAVGASVHAAVGAIAGGDWIRSSNLGDHRYARAAGYGEVRWHPVSRAVVQAGLRLDRYSTFGRSWSPTLSSGVWLTRTLRVRASTSRAFRIPTFTERYYQDPIHLARADLRAESGGAVDGGADWTPGAWNVSLGAFRRADRDVIDWTRPTVDDRWRTTNVRDVTTRGVEASASRRWRAALVRVAYAAHDVDAPTLTLLSKYVLEYARHSASASFASPIAYGLRGAVTVDHRRRVDGQTYTLTGLRLMRRLGRADFYVDASNLLRERYVEVPGVEMPGRWLTAGITVRH